MDEFALFLQQPEIIILKQGPFGLGIVTSGVNKLGFWIHLSVYRERESAPLDSPTTVKRTEIEIQLVIQGVSYKQNIHKHNDCLHRLWGTNSKTHFVEKSKDMSDCEQV